MEKQTKRQRAMSLPPIECAKCKGMLFEVRHRDNEFFFVCAGCKKVIG